MAIVLGMAVLVAGAVMAYAKGGTAKPPAGAVSPFITPTLADPVFSTTTTDINGFDETGFIQDATVSADNSACPDVTDPRRRGGTVTINNTQIVVPCNMVIQMPANTMTWAEMVNGGPSLALKDSPFPSFEVRVVGNIVAGKHMAGLMFASQQAPNSGSGKILKVNYDTGDLQVDTGDPANPAIVQINDPNGRFGRKQSPDARFSVDDQNPTIHAGTGYPMCVPRQDPATADDPLCPQVNRPKPVGAGRHCRNFTDAGVVPLPTSGELSAPGAGEDFCMKFVMPSVASRADTEPDPRQQAPFEVGDHITYSGTLVHGSGGDYISAHTIEANVGIYTQPATQPSYLAIGDFGVGTADPNAVAVSGVAQETQDRIFLETETTDVQTPVDIYMMDTDPRDGTVRNRWVTPFEMTGENQAGNPSGGITTQFTGPQPQRARLRATKAPVGLLSQPSRNIRVVTRSLCEPQAQLDQALLDACLNNAPKVANGLVAGQYYAPTFEFIFPENVSTGDPVVPFDLWHLPFLRYGEGGNTPTGVGPLEPTPWGAPVSDLPPLPDPPPPAPAPAAAAAPVAAGAGPAAAVPAAAPAPAGAVAAATATNGPVATALTAPATVAAATAARAGIVVRFAVPAGATTAAIKVLRQRGTKLALVGSQVVPVKRGVNRIALNGKTLRRKLARGRVVVEVRLRKGSGKAGAPKRIVVRIV
ncbi:MAG: hypothetical protein QOH72_1957 [Solirubrobacteraceae bacterium]|jgi:hypothetical protein|nr:hypothetical protein [Solirubrobacteraceae bacterium]